VKAGMDLASVPTDAARAVTAEASFPMGAHHE